MDDKNSKDILAENLRVFLARKKMSITELSRETGISRNTLTGIYYGKNEMIKFETLDKLAGFMNWNVYLLFNDD